MIRAKRSDSRIGSPRVVLGPKRYTRQSFAVQRKCCGLCTAERLVRSRCGSVSGVFCVGSIVFLARFSVMLSPILLQASIHFSPMPNMVNDDFLCLDIDAVNDPIISGSYSLQALRAFEFECLPWKRLVLQQFEALPHTATKFFGRPARSLSTDALNATL